MNDRNTFKKNERLKQKHLFDALRQDANRSFQHPLLGIWKEIELPKDSQIQIGWSISKKLVKNATDRNKIRRRLREAYRLQNQQLKQSLADKKKQITLLVIFLDSDNTSYDHLRHKMMLLLQGIASKIEHGK